MPIPVENPKFYIRALFKHGPPPADTVSAVLDAILLALIENPESDIEIKLDRPNALMLARCMAENIELDPCYEDYVLRNERN